MDWDAAEATGGARKAIGRRAFLASGAAGLTLPWLAPAGARAALSGIPADGKVAFKVMRKGAHIGEHRLTFSQDADGLTVTTDVRITVHIGPVPVYHHTQHCVEHWKGDRFVGLESTTNSNVSHDVVAARRTADGLRIEP